MGGGARILLAALAGLTAGCAAKEPDPGFREPRTFKAIPAPTRADVKTRVTAADEGKTVEARVGTAIAVEFVGTPTAGYMWSVVETPAFLRASGETGGPTSEAQLQEGFAGGSHWEVFFFDVIAAGEGSLKFEQRRPWETEGPPDDAFSVTVRAQ